VITTHLQRLEITEAQYFMTTIFGALTVWWHFVMGTRSP